MVRAVQLLFNLATLAACQQTVEKTSLVDAISPEAAPEKHSLRKMSETLQTAQQLIDKYYDIFKTGNRNAASHLWMSYVLQRTSTMTDSTIQEVLKGFCAISGSPVSNGNSAGRIYKVTLANVLGQNVTGVVRHCCWPCVCDMTDLVRVDTLTVQTSEGAKQYNMLVIGDPCDNPDQIEKEFTDPFDGYQRKLVSAAPELECVSSGTKAMLRGATYSDHGFPIIGFLFTDQKELDMWTPANELYQDWDPAHTVSSDDVAWGWGHMCSARAAAGYSSGMGLIFRLAAEITPIPRKVDSSKMADPIQSEVGSSKPLVDLSATTPSTGDALKTAGSGKVHSHDQHSGHEHGSASNQTSSNSSASKPGVQGASLASQSSFPGLLGIGGLTLWYGICQIP